MSIGPSCVTRTEDRGSRVWVIVCKDSGSRVYIGFMAGSRVCRFGNFGATRRVTTRFLRMYVKQCCGLGQALKLKP